MANPILCSWLPSAITPGTAWVWSNLPVPPVNPQVPVVLRPSLRTTLRARGLLCCQHFRVLRAKLHVIFQGVCSDSME